MPDDGEQPASDCSCRDDGEDGEPQEGRGVYQGGLADLGNGVGELDLAPRRSRGYGGGHGWEGQSYPVCGCKTMSSCGVVVRS